MHEGRCTSCPAEQDHARSEDASLCNIAADANVEALGISSRGAHFTGRRGALLRTTDAPAGQRHRQTTRSQRMSPQAHALRQNDSACHIAAVNGQR